MKTVCPLLVIAAVCCFAPVMSNVIRDGKDEQDSVAEQSCLEKAMKTDEKAVGRVIELACAYLKFKDIPDKEVLINKMQKLVDATDCTTEDIFGTSESLEKIVMDENGVLKSRIITMAELLNLHGVPPQSVDVICIVLPDNVLSADSVTQTRKGDDGLEHKRTTRDLLSLLGGLTGGSGGLGGLLSPVNTVTGLLGGLLGGGGQKQGGDLLGNLLGGLGGQKAACGQGTQGLGGVTDLLGGLLGGQGGGLLGGLLGGQGGGLLQGLLGGQGGLLGGLLGGQGGGLGGLGGLTKGLTGTLGGLTGGLTGGLLGGGGGAGGLLGLGR